MTTPSAADVNRFADKVMVALEKDMTVGFAWGAKLPRTVASWEEINLHCDGNEYLIDSSANFI